MTGLCQGLFSRTFPIAKLLNQVVPGYGVECERVQNVIGSQVSPQFAVELAHQVIV
jgi:hypothetical protein